MARQQTRSASPGKFLCKHNGFPRRPRYRCQLIYQLLNPGRPGGKISLPPLMNKEYAMLGILLRSIPGLGPLAPGPWEPSGSILPVMLAGLFCLYNIVSELAWQVNNSLSSKLILFFLSPSLCLAFCSYSIHYLVEYPMESLTPSSLQCERHQRLPSL
jgi:hypothetical protein